MRAHFITGLVHGFEWRTRQLELTARLQRYACAILLQTNQLAAFDDWLPIKPVAQAFQNCQNGGLTFVGKRAQTIAQKAELLMFSPNAPICFRLVASLEILDQLGFPRDTLGVFVDIRRRRGHNGGLPSNSCCECT